MHLHSTMFLLIPLSDQREVLQVVYLHSTMFLLIRGNCKSITGKISFTFHNVSINTQESTFNPALVEIFTFHNVSINTVKLIFEVRTVSHLHSTMFLLIPDRVVIAILQFLIYIPQCFY